MPCWQFSALDRRCESPAHNQRTEHVPPPQRTSLKDKLSDIYIYADVLNFNTFDIWFRRHIAANYVVLLLVRISGSAKPALLKNLQCFNHPPSACSENPIRGADRLSKQSTACQVRTLVLFHPSAWDTVGWTLCSSPEHECSLFAAAKHKWRSQVTRAGAQTCLCTFGCGSIRWTRPYF